MTIPQGEPPVGGDAADGYTRYVTGIADLAAYVVFRLLWVVAGCVPLPVLRRTLGGAARVVSIVDRGHRRVIRENLSVAFPGLPPDRVRAVCVAAFSNWARIGAELVHADEIAARYRDDPAFAEVERTARRLLALQRGLVVLTAHTGNFELLARILGRNTGIRFGVFHRAMSNARIDAFLIGARRRDGFLSFGRGAAVRRALELLGQGGAVVVPLDQNQKPGNGVFVDFFGKAAATSPSLARMALAAGAPILPVFAAWEGDRIVPLMGTPTLPQPDWPRLRGTERNEAVLAITQGGVNEIESVIARYPEQWNWAHRRWKTRPGE